MYLSKVLLFLFTLAFAAGCAKNIGLRDSDMICQEGEVIYNYKKGTMQCLSQRDPSGQIVVLAQGLDKNTSVDVLNVGVSDEQEYLVEFLLTVVKEDTGFKSWKDLQEVHILIEPLDVPEITLTGKPVFVNNGFTILKASPTTPVDDVEAF